jgi:asparagine synthetase B (glutamine-hydrolysing)
LSNSINSIIYQHDDLPVSQVFQPHNNCIPSMCGILLKLGPSQAALSAAVPTLRDEVAKRGPDCTQTHSIDITDSDTGPAISLEFTSSVLSLRGQHVVKQPLVDERYVFCWNGQVFRGLDVNIAENDTERIWKAILAGRDIVDILDEVEGP